MFTNLYVKTDHQVKFQEGTFLSSIENWCLDVAARAHFMLVWKKNGRWQRRMCPSREIQPRRGSVREVFKGMVQELGANRLRWQGILRKILWVMGGTSPSEWKHRRCSEGWVPTALWELFPQLLDWERGSHLFLCFCYCKCRRDFLDWFNFKWIMLGWKLVSQQGKDVGQTIRSHLLCNAKALESQP